MLRMNNYQEYNSYRGQSGQGMQQGINNWPEAEERRKATENHIVVVVFMWLQNPLFSWYFGPKARTSWWKQHRSHGWPHGWPHGWTPRSHGCWSDTGQAGQWYPWGGADSHGHPIKARHSGSQVSKAPSELTALTAPEVCRLYPGQGGLPNQVSSPRCTASQDLQRRLYRYIVAPSDQPMKRQHIFRFGYIIYIYVHKRNTAVFAPLAPIWLDWGNCFQIQDVHTCQPGSLLC